MACTLPPEVDNGFVAFSSIAPNAVHGWTSGSTITYDCFKFHSLVDSDTLTCSKTGTSWTGTLPKCEYSRSTESKVLFFFLILQIVYSVIFGFRPKNIMNIS